MAQGTFYLYFASKDELVATIAAQAAARMVDDIEAHVCYATANALDKFEAIPQAIISATADAASADLAGAFHRPENAVIHDRMAERIALAADASDLRSAVEQVCVCAR